MDFERVPQRMRRFSIRGMQHVLAQPYVLPHRALARRLTGHSDAEHAGGVDVGVEYVPKRDLSGEGTSGMRSQSEATVSGESA